MFFIKTASVSRSIWLRALTHCNYVDSTHITCTSFLCLPLYKGNLLYYFNISIHIELISKQKQYQPTQVRTIRQEKNLIITQTNKSIT